jgi:hypothetical protein
MCEAEAYLGELCPETTKARLVYELGAKPGEGSALIGGMLVPRLSLGHSRLENDNWYVAQKEPHGEPVIFCPLHAEKGREVLDGKG